MNQLVNSLYKNTIDQVLLIEKSKKDLSKQILLVKEGQKRLNLISSFLSYDLNKHELLEHALVVAMNNKEESVINQIRRLYSHIEDEDVLHAIRNEIKMTRKFLETIRKVAKYPHFATFSERRLVQEVSKFVTEQARLYNQM